MGSTIPRGCFIRNRLLQLAVSDSAISLCASVYRHYFSHTPKKKVKHFEEVLCSRKVSSLIFAFLRRFFNIFAARYKLEQSSYLHQCHSCRNSFLWYELDWRHFAVIFYSFFFSWRFLFWAAIANLSSIFVPHLLAKHCGRGIQGTLVI